MHFRFLNYAGQFSALHTCFANFFVKSQCSFLKNSHLTIFLQNFFSNSIFFFAEILIATFGARVCGSVFKIEFRFLVRDFEYVETSPGFAQLLEENWI